MAVARKVEDHRVVNLACNIEQPKDRLRRGVDKLRYETGDREISEASMTEAALDEYLKARGL